MGNNYAAMANTKGRHYDSRHTCAQVGFLEQTKNMVKSTVKASLTIMHLGPFSSYTINLLVWYKKSNLQHVKIPLRILTDTANLDLKIYLHYIVVPWLNLAIPLHLKTS